MVGRMTGWLAGCLSLYPLVCHRGWLCAPPGCARTADQQTSTKTCKEDHVSRKAGTGGSGSVSALAPPPASSATFCLRSPTVPPHLIERHAVRVGDGGATATSVLNCLRLHRTEQQQRETNEPEAQSNQRFVESAKPQSRSKSTERLCALAESSVDAHVATMSTDLKVDGICFPALTGSRACGCSSRGGGMSSASCSADSLSG